MSTAVLHRRRPFLAAAALLAIALAPGLRAIEVDRAELEKGASSEVIFINYEGPHAVINSRNEIRGVGTELGARIAAGASRAGATNRYFVIHAVDPAVAQGLDADILGLGVDAGVDHIRNLRWIIQGYLQAAYSYSEQDAALLAEYITIYNAVYRGSWDYFSATYKQVVTSKLSPDKAGLSLRYDEWPGKSLVVIPLTTLAAQGKLSSIDTSSLTGKPVTEQLKSGEDKGLDQRKAMVDLKEREADQAAQGAALEREAIVAEEARIAAEKADLEKQKQELAAKQAEQAAQQDQTAAAGDGAAQEGKAGGTAADGGQKAADQGAEVQAKQEEIAKKEADIAQQEQALQERKDTAAAQEELAAKKESEAATERKDIAADQQQQIAEEKAAAPPPPTGTLVTAMRDQTSPYARLLIADLAGGKVLKTSAVDTVRPRAMVEQGGKIYAIAGIAAGNGAVRLVSIDPATLELLGQGSQDLRDDSLLWSSGGDLYALAVVGSTTRLARFGADLALKALSPEPVHPFAAPVFSAEGIIVQGPSGEVLVLDADKLARKAAVK